MYVCPRSPCFMESERLRLQKNVLIDNDGNARIMDFGQAVVGDLVVNDVVPLHGATCDIPGGIRWIAPEILAYNSFESRKTAASDVFSFGRICLAVCALDGTQDPSYSADILDMYSSTAVS
jgi:serine/threonine protein kinase